MKSLRWILVLFCFHYSVCVVEAQLNHVKGINSFGVRGGIGTKNLFAVGLTYNYHFNSKLSLNVEVDHERAKFGTSNFVGVAFLSPGVEYSVWSPLTWLYVNLSLAGSVGYDIWKNDFVDDEVKGIVGGVNAGCGLEFVPWHFLSLTLRTQQYLLFGNDDQYLKPLFTVGVKYNFSK